MIRYLARVLVVVVSLAMAWRNSEDREVAKVMIWCTMALMGYFE